MQPRIIGEFDDSALMQAFGQSGSGLFIAPSVIEPLSVRLTIDCSAAVMWQRYLTLDGDSEWARAAERGLAYVALATARGTTG